MTGKVLDPLGEVLMRRVRDEAILDWDMIIDGRMKSPRAQHLRAVLSQFSPEELAIVSSLVPRIVDTTLHHLLWALDQEASLRLAVKTGAGELPDVRAVSDGLPGELYTEDGWIARFSKQRHDEG